jgi:hypothetical protein
MPVTIDLKMSFRTYDKARKYLVRAGVAGAPFAIAFHACPKSHEHTLAPPEHIEQHAYDPLEVQRIEVVTSTSGSGDVTVKLTGVAAAGSVGSVTPSTTVTLA